jgi:hypothetical protein
MSSPYEFSDIILKEPATQVQSDPSLINAGAETTTFLNPEYIEYPGTIFSEGVIERSPLMVGQDGVGILNTFVKACDYLGLINAGAETTIFLDPIACAHPSTIFLVPDQREPHVIPGENYDMFGYI